MTIFHRVSHSAGKHGGVSPISYDFSKNPFPHQNLSPMGCSLLKTTPPFKSETPFQEIIPRKKPWKMRNCHYTCTSIIKQHWKKMAEIPQAHDFLTWSIQNFVRKEKQLVRKYYITWLSDLNNKLYDTEKFLISFYAICY